ncbi:major facilitator superfamily domain-containing protein [Flagelloscypha sp. PMI_526]|nr:major facilitator superfamily domain-containing protein [Flagelloscypha sp. PMI_526]
MASEGLLRFFGLSNTLPTPPTTPGGGIPGIYSLPRLVCLLASLLVALAAGTNYVFSAYSPQLGERLHITHTQLNMVGLAGNIGVYGSGPLWGKLVDLRGPRLNHLLGFLFLLIGYSGIRSFYVSYEGETEPIHTLGFAVLLVCSVLSGAGGNGGFMAAVNATAKSFPDQLRGSATAIVLSGFGLSAFLFSTLAHYAFPGNTGSFLLLLSLGTSFPMLIGAIFVRPVPLPMSEGGVGTLDTSAHEPLLSPNEPRSQRVNSSTALIGDDDSDDDMGYTHRAEPTTPAADYIPGAESSLELGVSRSMSRNRSESRRSSASRAKASAMALGQRDISGKRLFLSLDFWTATIVLSILSGTGLMYINNVGSMAQALFTEGKDTYSEAETAKQQAVQVSTISVLNCSGRIIIGVLNDLAKNKFRLPRSTCLILVAFMMLISQFIAHGVDDLAHLWQASSALGIAYGATFGLYPTLAIEWFGMPHLSENWGWMSLSPVVGSNIFSLIFGRNLDAHETHDPTTSALLLLHRQKPDEDHVVKNLCKLGKGCYVDTFKLTIGANIIALIMSAYIAWRDWRREQASGEDELEVFGNGRNNPVWDEDEDV